MSTWRRLGSTGPWLWFAVLGLAMIAGYFLLGDPDAQDFAYQVPETLATLAVLAGIWIHRPTRWVPWLLLAIGLALTTAGDWTWLILDRVYGLDPFPSVADAFYLAGMAGLALGTVELLRGRVPGGDRAGILDAAIVAVGLGVISWVFVMAPTVADPSQSLVELIVGLAYPLIDVALLAVLARLIFIPGRREPALLLLIGAVLAFLAADFPYAIIALNDGYTVGSPLDAGWLLGAVLWGTAALHPSMREIAQPAAASEARLTTWRLALLAGASLMAPLVLLVQWLTDGSLYVPVVAGGSVVLFLLVIGRLETVVADLRRTLDQRRVLEQELELRAFHDPLTGLANRAVFHDRLEHALARRDSRVAVLFLDLDDFKTVNDAFGHQAGDTLLRAVADSIRAVMRPGDTVARLGGDEFAVLVDHDADPFAAGLIAERLLKAAHVPVRLAGQEHAVTASIGISLSGGERSSPEALMRDADIAMYVSKGQGKGGFTVFEPTEHAAVLRGLELRTDLEHAIREQQFILHYQPIVELGSLQQVGVEALVRWNHPNRGLVGPDEFVGLAEATGAILPLGRWIMAEAVRQAAAWTDAGLTSPDALMSVNVSAVQLADPTFPAFVRGVLADAGLRPQRLVVEVTETVRLDQENVTANLHALEELDVQLAMDDFGTGYGALSHLLRTRFDLVKVDRTFVEHLTSDDRTWPLLSGLVELARRVGARVVAEGIDDPAALGRLREAGCDLGQGFLFAPPLAPAELVRVMREANPAAASNAAPRRAARTRARARHVAPRPT